MVWIKHCHLTFHACKVSLFRKVYDLQRKFLCWEQLHWHGMGLKTEFKVRIPAILKVLHLVPSHKSVVSEDQKIKTSGHNQSFQQMLRERQYGHEKSIALVLRSDSEWLWIGHSASLKLDPSSMEWELNPTFKISYNSKTQLFHSFF